MVILKEAIGRKWLAAGTLFWMTLLFAGLGADVFHQINKKNTGAFETYLFAAKAVQARSDPYAANYVTYYYVYPPFFAFVCQPLTHLSPNAAARVMVALDGSFIVAALLLASRAMLARFRLKADGFNVSCIALGTAILVVVPIHNEMRGMETNSIVLLSFVLALFWLDRHPILSGLALAVSINIKYLPLIAVPYLLLRRRWVAAIATLCWTVVLGLLPALSVGWSTNLRYLQTALGGLLHLVGAKSTSTAKVQSIDIATSISVTSVLSRLVNKLAAPHVLAPMLTAIAAALFIGAIFIRYRNRRLPLLRWPDATRQFGTPYGALLAMEWAALVTFTLAFSPNTQNRNLVLAIVPGALVAMLLRFPPAGRVRVWIVIATAILWAALILPIAQMGKPFTVAWVNGGWPCWCLLLTYVLLHPAALSKMQENFQPRLVAGEIKPIAPLPPRNAA